MSTRLGQIDTYRVGYHTELIASHDTALVDALTRSCGIRAALARKRLAASTAYLARATMAQCAKLGVELQEVPWHFGLACIAIHRRERASRALREAIERQSEALVLLLHTAASEERQASLFANEEDEAW